MNTKSFFITILICLALATGSCKKSETAPPNISIQDIVTLPEGNEQQSIAIIPVTLSLASDQQVSFLWSTADGTAKAGQDFVAVTDTLLVFQPGETTKNIEVKIVGDLVFEPDETFYVTGTNAKNGNMVKNRASITITNDDVFVPVLSVAANTKVIEGNTTMLTAKVTVALSDIYDKEVSCKWSTADGTAKAGADYVPVTGATLVFAPGEKIKYLDVLIASDEVLEFNESFYVNIDEVTNATAGNLQSKVTIADNDSYIPEMAADGPVTPDNYPGMKLVWGDEFNATAINMNNWTFELGGGGWGNNELEVYTNSADNAYVADGKLNIVATKTSAGYNSARMVTKGKQEFTYGRIDIRAKLPVGQGIWPALWMLGANISQVGWPKCGEIDIMEYLGHDVTKVYGTAHYDDGGHQYKGGWYTLPAGQGFNDKFHVFTILWQENSIVWYVDYQKYYEVNATTIKFDAFNLAQFFIFNLAVGGIWPGNPDGTTVFPQRMQVDYVRVFMPE
jgi:beta-glucanase (GH16 family)